METATHVDLNTANFEKLVEVPGIGEALAQRILDNRPFDTFNDVVERVKGIGLTSLKKLTPYVTVNHNIYPLTTGDETMEENEETRTDLIEISPEAEAEAEVPADLVPLPPLPPVEPWTEPVEGVAGEIEDEAPDVVEAELPPPLPDETPPVEMLEEEEVVEEMLAAVEPLPEGVDLESETAPATVEPVIAEVEEEIAVEPVAEEAPAAPEVEAAPEKAPEPRPVPAEKPAPKMVKRGQLVWTSILILFLAIIAAVALSVGIIAGVNNGNLLFASPSDVNRLSQAVNALDGRAATLEQSLDGVQARLDNLEALSGRIDKLESDAGAMQGELDTLASETETIGQGVEALNEETTALGEAVDEVQAQAGRFQAVMDGLRDLLNNLFPSD